MKSKATMSGFALLPALCGLALLLASGCSMLRAYPQQMRSVQNAFAHGNYEHAASELEAMAPARRDKLCHLFELGTVRHTMGDYKASNTLFLAAVGLSREFDERAAVSLRDSAAFTAALLINDKAMSYRGSPFERVLLHTYLAMNFLMQRDLEGARVEILRAYAKQKEAREEHAKRIDKTKKEATKRKLDTSAIVKKVRAQYNDQQALLKKAGNVYQNAFTYYLSAVVYELGGEIDDAYIDVKTVHALNPNFLPARRDLLRHSRKLGFLSDYEAWKEEFGADLEESLPAGHGEIVLLYQCGLAPVKEEVKFAFPIPVKKRFSMVTVAIPKYRSRPDPVHAAKLSADGNCLGTTQALMDVEATAVRDLWDQAAEIAVRQLLRAAGRVAAAEYARREMGPLAFLAVLFVSHMVEQADLRSWLTLPHDFQVLRAALPAGSHRIEMALLGGGASGCVSLPEVPVRAGRMTIISLRSVGNRGTANYVAF